MYKAQTVSARGLGAKALPLEAHRLYNRMGDVFDHFERAFWQYHYRLARTVMSLTTLYGWSLSFIPFETLMSIGITKYMYMYYYYRGYFLNFYSSWIIHCFSLVQVYKKSRCQFFLLTKSSIIISKSTCTCLCICISDQLDSRSLPIVDLK